MKGLFSLISSGIWFDMKLASKDNKQTWIQSNRPILSTDTNIAIAKYQNHSGFLQDMPSGRFPRVCHFHWNLCLEPEWSVVINGFSEEASIELLVSVRLSAGPGDTEGIRLRLWFQEIVTFIRVSWYFRECTSYHFLLFMTSL